MGWWRARRDGASLQLDETGLSWGDGPADLLDDVLGEIVSDFKRAFGRPPTKGELRAGLEFSIGSGGDDEPFDPDDPGE